MRKFLLAMTLALVPGFFWPAVAKFPDIIVTDYGAAGDGVNDDSNAFAIAINVAAQQAAADFTGAIRVPAGRYLLKSKTLPMMPHGQAIIGDGQHQTYIILDPAYRGDVFSWSESWVVNFFNGPSLNPLKDKTGPTVKNLSITGNTTSPNRQNAIMFYDRDDFVDIEDVDIMFIPGQCMGIGGNLRNAPIAYVRESFFSNVRCFNSGLPGVPAVSIGSKTSIQGADASNQLKFFNLNIFAAVDVGLAITAESQYSNTRTLEFHGLRVEYSGGDNIRLGSDADLGKIYHINFFGLRSTSPGQTASGHFAINFDTAGQQMYGINVQGGIIGPCFGSATCLGVNIGNIRGAFMQFVDIATAGANITYTGSAGAPVTLTGNPASWTVTGSPP